MAGVAAAFKTLSDDHVAQVQYLLADIPFFCIGILSLGVFTFFVFMRRVDSIILCLHMAVLTAFIASILDLVQMLIRGADAVDKGIDTKSVQGLITVREVGYALSFGLRFLFFWGFVAQPVPGEVLPEGKTMHNGSWGRWGLLGIILQMFTLTLVLVDPVLQILYRNVTILHKIGPVYEIEAAIQIVLSSVFILKLLLNSWVRLLVNMNSAPARTTLLGYSGVIIALSLGVLIGIGNVAMFEFTETVLGRFLQGVQLYIVIVQVLTNSFYHLRRKSWFNSSSSLSINRHPSRPSISEKSIQITAPVISSPDLLRVVGRNVSPRSSPAQNASSRISSWLNLRRVSDRISGRGPSAASPEQDKAPLWEQGQAEKGYSPDREIPIPDSAIDLESPQSYKPTLVNPLPSARWQEPAYITTASISKESMKSSGSNATAMYDARPPQTSPGLDNNPSVFFNAGRSPERPQLTIPPPAHSRQATVETPYLATQHGSPPSMYGSPMSGIEDAINNIGGYEDRVFLPTATGDAMHSARSSRISELIRQQAELDKSIAALRLFSPSEKTFDSRRPPPSGEGGSAEDRNTRSTTQSDLSLSNFPDPPWCRASVASAMSANGTVVPGIEARDAETVVDEIVIRPPSDAMQPYSPKGINLMDEYARIVDRAASPDVDAEATLTSRHRVNSGGTQYEITSFIGGLTHRGNYEPGSFSSSVLTSGEDGPLVPPSFPKTHGSSDSFGSLRLRQYPLTLDEEMNVPAADQPPVEQAPGGLSPEDQSSIPRRSFLTPDSRFSRPVGLPPRPRLTIKDPLTPVSEASSH
ncbi:hypothetical protein WOLCODRAFT_147619 [Wolfiporia cocos MD-104 SS10]|uniref:Uncharacterized protein n=1 Tax=Wolfiporia cocos (strain MD-104) TaxID=742152 RepID=A0A2H3IVS9_WOLCO|nr:hypothetical protein WOLCODRAFT_147619 [Wolfiporia cocos MD-104 SS10]